MAVLKGLVPGVLYQVEVAAVSSAGVGTHSQPVPIRKLHPPQGSKCLHVTNSQGLISNLNGASEYGEYTHIYVITILDMY